LDYGVVCFVDLGSVSSESGDAVIKTLFLTCALALPSANSTQPAIVSYQAAKSEQERLTDWLRKNNPGAEVFIHPEPQEEKLKEYGWERVPFTWRGNKIWIKRKPNVQKLEASA
jgi:hypothetical protein